MRLGNNLPDMPRVMSLCQGGHRRRADTVPAHMDLVSLRERLAVCAVGDDVVRRKALRSVQLGRLQHSQSDIDDHVRRALNHHGDQAEAIFCGDRRRGLVAAAHVLGAVVADQESSNAQRTFFVLGRQLEADQRALASAARRDGRRGLIQVLAEAGAELGSMKAVTSPWCVPPALTVWSGSAAARASQLPRRCRRCAEASIWCCPVVLVTSDAVTIYSWLPVFVTVVTGSSRLFATVVLETPVHLRHESCSDGHGVRSAGRALIVAAAGDGRQRLVPRFAFVVKPELHQMRRGERVLYASSDDGPQRLIQAQHARLAASRLAVACAIWRHVGPAHRFAIALGIRITIVHVGGEVLGARMVDGVHADRFGAVVFRHAQLAPEAYFQVSACAATAAEKVNDELIFLRLKPRPY
jgi:hypothetical protein